MKIKRLNEALEDELDILLVASDCRCKLSQYDIEEAADLEQLAQYIKKSGKEDMESRKKIRKNIMMI